MEHRSRLGDMKRPQITLPAPVLPERYRAALADREPLACLAKAPKRVKKLIKGSSKKKLQRAPSAEQWSAQTVVAHLCDAEVMFGARIRFIIAMDRPAIIGWDENAFAAKLPHATTSVEELLAAWKSLRALHVALLEALPQEAWSRVGLHTERGEESLSTLVHLAAAHDLVHEAQIERCLTKAKPAKAKTKAVKQVRQAK